MITNVLEKMTDVNYLVKFGNKFAELSSLQRNIINYLVTNSQFCGTYSDFMKAVRLKNKNANMNNKLIKWLSDKNIISIKEFNIDNIPSEYRQFITVKGWIKTFRLTDNWLDNLYNADDFSYDDVNIKKGE